MYLRVAWTHTRKRVLRKLEKKKLHVLEPNMENTSSTRETTWRIHSCSFLTGSRRWSVKNLNDVVECTNKSPPEQRLRTEQKFLEEHVRLTKSELKIHELLHRAETAEAQRNEKRKEVEVLTEQLERMLKAAEDAGPGRDKAEPRERLPPETIQTEQCANGKCCPCFKDAGASARDRALQVCAGCQLKHCLRCLERY